MTCCSMHFIGDDSARPPTWAVSNNQDPAIDGDKMLGWIFIMLEQSHLFIRELVLELLNCLGTWEALRKFEIFILRKVLACVNCTYAG